MQQGCEVTITLIVKRVRHMSVNVFIKGLQERIRALAEKWQGWEGGRCLVRQSISDRWNIIYKNTGQRVQIKAQWWPDDQDWRVGGRFKKEEIYVCFPFLFAMNQLIKIRLIRTIKKAECQRLDAFNLFWKRFLRVPFAARRSNESILKEINLQQSLEELFLKLKLQYFGYHMGRADLLEKTLMLGKIEGRRRRGWQRWDDR